MEICFGGIVELLKTIVINDPVVAFCPRAHTEDDEFSSSIRLTWPTQSYLRLAVVLPTSAMPGIERTPPRTVLESDLDLRLMTLGRAPNGQNVHVDKLAQ